MMARLTSVQVIALCFLSLCPSFELSATKREKNSARSGDLLFLVTAVESPETVLRKGWMVPNRPMQGYHFVVVHVKVKNLGKRAACAHFRAGLKAEFGIFQWRNYVFDDSGPQIHELLPGEETTGSYVFDVKDGVKPLEVILEPNGSQGCGTEKTFPDFDRIRIPLEGVETSPKP